MPALPAGKRSDGYGHDITVAEDKLFAGVYPCETSLSLDATCDNYSCSGYCGVCYTVGILRANLACGQPVRSYLPVV